MRQRWQAAAVGARNLAKGLAATILCLGTIGTTLVALDVAPAYATGVPVVNSMSPMEGLPTGGTAVVLLGLNLGNPTAIDFGSTPGTFVSGTSGKITVDAPAGTLGTTVPVTVTTAGGTSTATAATQFTYIGAPTVTALHGDSAPFAGGNSIIVDGTNFVNTPTVLFNTTASPKVTLLNSTQLLAQTPPLPGEPGSIPQTPVTYNVTVKTGAGTSATSTASNFYWFGGGTCTFSGSGLVTTNVPPGTVGYVTNTQSGVTSITTSCTGITSTSGGQPALLSPFIQSMSSPMAAIVTGTGPGGNGGNEVWGGWTGQNGYYTTSSPNYNPSGGFVVPPASEGSGGCPVGPSNCALAQSEGDAVNYGTDPDATCPPSQAQVNAGLINCGIAAVIANQNGNTYSMGTIEISFADEPTPAQPSFSLASSTGLTPGQSVDLNSCSSCNWWGSGENGAPTYLASQGQGLPTAVPAPTVWIGSTRDTAVEAQSNIAVSPATYDCGSSGGASKSPPGPVANCTLGQGTISGSFTVPAGLTNGTYNVYIDEPNLSLDQSSYSGSTPYNVGLSYNLVNAVEASTTITVGTGPSGPAVTGVSPSSGPAAGGNSVTITGSGFTGASAVNFCSTPATAFTVNSDTSITATAPSGSGTCDVTVSAGGSTSPTVPADEYTYVPLPVVTGISPTSGPAAGGTSVTVTGTGFTGASAVDFCSAPATSYTVNSDTSITATAPGGSGTCDITVTTAGGTSAQGPADEYTYNPPPVVSGIAPTSGPAAGGTSVTISGSGFSGATAVHFGSNAASGFTVNSSTSITATSPAGSGTVDVTVTTPNGTSSTSGADQFTYPPLPTVTGLSPTSGPAAGGTPVTITGTGFTGATAVAFGSTPATTFTVNSDTSITATSPGGTGVVDVTVTTPNGTSLTGPGDRFSYISVPAVAGLTPTSGPQGGGTSVTVTGSGFTGATAVDFGGLSATVFTVNSDTSITVNSPSSPSASTVDVTVTTPGGTSTTSPADEFTYIAPPQVSGLSPSSGPGAGGTSVTISGSNFTGATVVDFGLVAASHFTVNSDSSITATSPGGSGTVDVRVTTGGGQSAIAQPADQFTYIPPPTVTGVSPSSGPPSGNTSVTITGTGFTGATAVAFGSTPATAFTVNSATSITATSPAGSGTVHVTVTTPNGTSTTSSADQFSYGSPPTVTALAPSSGPAAGSTSVALTGTGFLGATAVQFGANPAVSFTVNSATSITATSPPGSGTVNVTVTTPSGTSVGASGNAYTYIPPPSVSGISPTSGLSSGSTSVTITGANFTGVTAVKFGSATASFQFQSATSITASSPPGSGTVDVTVVTPGGTSTTSPADQFTYISPPSVSGVSPSSGSAAGGTVVNVSGANLTGATAVRFGTTAATSFTVNSATSITATSPGGGGTVNVTVTTPGGTSGTSSADQFTYTAPPPTVTSVSPSSGPTTGGTSVTVTGTGFTGATQVKFGATEATSFSVGSATSITATSPSGSGTVDVTVTGPTGTSTIVAGDEFTYVAPPVPTVSRLNPSSGPQTGGTLVMITGTGFTGATAVHFGSRVGTGLTVASSTTLQVATPGSTSLGAVPVTVTTPGGTSTSEVSFTYVVAAPTVTGLSPSSGSTLGGTTVTVSGSGFSAGSLSVFFGTTQASGVTIDSDGTLTVTAPPGMGTVHVTVLTQKGVSAATPADEYTYTTPPPVPSGAGYWLLGSDGGVFSFGGAAFYGSAASVSGAGNIVAMAASGDGRGYWEAASNGAIFSFGDAPFYGSMGGTTLRKPIVGMAATPDGRGYWLVASDGGIFAFGDAGFYGSTGALNLNKPIEAMTPTPDGQGYWMVASDGGIFAFGDAGFYGSTGGLALTQPVVGMATDPLTGGYWLVQANGGVFSFNAPYIAPSGGLSGVVGMEATADGGGYWLVASNGAVYAYGDAPFYGSMGGQHLAKPVVGMALT